MCFTVNELKEKRSSSEKKYAARIEEAERDLTTRQQLLMGYTLRAQFVSIGISVAAFWFVGTLFDEVIVGRLPFAPIAWFANMTHRRLPGEDLRDASYLYFFVLANMACRPFVAKIVGSERPKSESAPDFFAMVSKLAQADQPTAMRVVPGPRRR